jgi:hypothetical protein
LVDAVFGGHHGRRARNTCKEIEDDDDDEDEDD